MRLAWVAVVTLGCGARVAPDDAVADSAVDAFVLVDTSIDTTPSIDTAPLVDTMSAIDTKPPPPMGCAAIEPKRGDPCAKVGEPCSWNSPCGGVDRGVCTPSGWSIDRGLCPPPSATCPATRPTKGGACSPAKDPCFYGNACGAVVAATCTPSGWSITEFACKEGCPRAAPVIGSGCTLPPDIKTCDYTFGPTCSFSCLCYRDRWTCYGTPCTDPPVGSGLED